MSIRLRLTLFYSAILALTLIVFSTILYATQSEATYSGIKANLVRQSGFFASGPRHFPNPPGAPPGSGTPGGADPGANMPNGFLPGRWTQTRALEGTIMGRTADLSDATLPLSAQGLKAVQNGSGWFETAQVQDQPLLIYSQSFLTQTGTREIVQSAFPISQPQQSLNTLRLILLIGCSLAIVTAFAVGWFLAGITLRPINRITRTAQAIGAEHDFSRRVQHTGPTDEIGQLALTFNEMLEELESAYRQLQGALESQRRFVADASHELRTPLTTIRGNIELLGRQPPIDLPERADVLADTKDEVQRLIRLVHQLLVLARADAGQPLRHDPVPVKPLLDDVCRQVRLLAPGRAINFEPPPDVLVLGDRDALKQVFLILLDNALVHTSAGAEVGMSVAANDGHVVVSVRDTGAGIAADMLPHIFERFYRGQVSRSGRGTGLGLAIAKELIEGQSGTIEVESKPGQGSTFTVRLPQASE